MAGSRKPGPLGLRAEVQNLNDGTMIRGLSLRPGTTKAKAISIAGPHGSSAETTPKTRTHNKKNINSGVQVLRQGSQGAEVKKLQRQLNVRLTPSPGLAVDGVFGTHTFQAVLQYQRGVPIAADGIVGTQTWYHLLKGDNATAQPALSEPNVAPKNAPENPPQHVSVPLAPAKGIWEWPLEDKFAESLRRTGPKLPSNIRSEFEAMLSPTSLAVMAGTLVVWAGSHAFGIGEVVDIILLIGGAFFLGLSVLDVASDLGDFLVGASTATEEKDLDEAASHLAKAIAVMGVAAFMALLAKVARGKKGSGTSTEATQNTVAAKPQSGTKISSTEPHFKAQQPVKALAPPVGRKTTYPGHNRVLSETKKLKPPPTPKQAEGRKLAAEAMKKDHNDPKGIWDQKALNEGVLDKRTNKIDETPMRIKERLDDFASGKPGSGQSVKNLDLAGKTPQQIHDELIAKGFTLQKDKNGNREMILGCIDGDAPYPTPHDIYLHPDGGMVRVKPEGHLGNPLRPEPHVSKSVLIDPKSVLKDPEKGTERPNTEWANEAFKVTNDGYAVPKAPSSGNGMRNDLSSELQVGYHDQVMEAAHTNLPEAGDK